MAARKKPGDDPPAWFVVRAEAEARVANAVRAVVRQRNIATALRRRNTNASDAEARLAQLERKLSDFEQQLASIINEQANN